jgi:hypothetical protein
VKAFLIALREHFIDSLHFWNPHRSGAGGGAICGLIIFGIAILIGKLF